MKAKDVLFFTYVDEKYHHFVLPYLFSLMKLNLSADVIVDNKKKFFDTYGKKLANLHSKVSYSGNTTVHGAYYYGDFSKLIPNIVRFVIQPEVKCKYTYITDCDMIINQEMLEKALENNIDGMQKNNAPFFNIKRENRDVLSGVHFVETMKYYPKIVQYLDKIEDLSTINAFGDEGFLYKMVKEVFGDPEKLTEGNERILPGYHLSPNRNKKYTEIKNLLCKDEDWKYAFSQFSEKFLALF